MFEKLRMSLRKRRRRKSMRPRHSARASTRRQPMRFGPVVMIGGVVVVVAGLAALIIFVLVPLFGGNGATEDTVAEATPTPVPVATPMAQDDMSAAAVELQIDYKSISDPYVFGSEVVFTTDPEESSQLSKIGIYNTETGETSLIETIEKKYFSLFEPKINADYIVYLDCKNEYGGAVCCYDRESDETFVLREYLYGKPQVAMVGNYALWIQQTSDNRDKLYMFDLSSRENTVIRVFINPMTFIGSADMSENALVFVQPYQQENVVGYGTSSSEENELCVMPLSEGGDKEAVLYYPGMFIYEPKIDGDYIAFLNGSGDETSQLMVCHKEGDSYSEPVSIAEGVMNYDVGEGYVTYTLDDVVYIYYFEDESSGRLSPDLTRARLASANGKDIVWYDVTGGFDADTEVIMHITVP